MSEDGAAAAASAAGDDGKQPGGEAQEQRQRQVRQAKRLEVRRARLRRVLGGRVDPEVDQLFREHCEMAGSAARAAYFLYKEVETFRRTARGAHALADAAAKAAAAAADADAGADAGNAGAVGDSSGGKQGKKGGGSGGDNEDAAASRAATRAAVEKRGAVLERRARDIVEVYFPARPGDDDDDDDSKKEDDADAGGSAIADTVVQSRSPYAVNVAPATRVALRRGIERPSSSSAAAAAAAAAATVPGGGAEVDVEAPLWLVPLDVFDAAQQECLEQLVTGPFPTFLRSPEYHTWRTSFREAKAKRSSSHSRPSSAAAASSASSSSSAPSGSSTSVPPESTRKPTQQQPQQQQQQQAEKSSASAAAAGWGARLFGWGKKTEGGANASSSSGRGRSGSRGGMGESALSILAGSNAGETRSKSDFFIDLTSPAPAIPATRPEPTGDALEELSGFVHDCVDRVIAAKPPSAAAAAPTGREAAAMAVAAAGGQAEGEDEDEEEDEDEDGDDGDVFRDDEEDSVLTTAEMDRLHEAFETEAGRRAFAVHLNFRRADATLTYTAFDILWQLVKVALIQADIHADWTTGKLLLHMAATYSWVPEHLLTASPANMEAGKEYLQVKLRGMAIWQKSEFWKFALYDAVGVERDKMARIAAAAAEAAATQSATPSSSSCGSGSGDGGAPVVVVEVQPESQEEAQERERGMFFGQLGSFTMHMLALGVPVEDTQDFLRKECYANALLPEMVDMLMQNVPNQLFLMQAREAERESAAAAAAAAAADAAEKEAVVAGASAAAGASSATARGASAAAASSGGATSQSSTSAAAAASSSVPLSSSSTSSSSSSTAPPSAVSAAAVSGVRAEIRRKRDAVEQALARADAVEALLGEFDNPERAEAEAAAAVAVVQRDFAQLRELLDSRERLVTSVIEAQGRAAAERARARRAAVGEARASLSAHIPELVALSEKARAGAGGGDSGFNEAKADLDRRVDETLCSLPEDVGASSAAAATVGWGHMVTPQFGLGPLPLLGAEDLEAAAAHDASAATLTDATVSLAAAAAGAAADGGGRRGVVASASSSSSPAVPRSPATVARTLVRVCRTATDRAEKLSTVSWAVRGWTELAGRGGVLRECSAPFRMFGFNWRLVLHPRGSSAEAQAQRERRGAVVAEQPGDDEPLSLHLEFLDARDATTFEVSAEFVLDCAPVAVAGPSSATYSSRGTDGAAVSQSSSPFAPQRFCFSAKNRVGGSDTFLRHGQLRDAANGWLRDDAVVFRVRFEDVVVLDPDLGRR